MKASVINFVCSAFSMHVMLCYINNVRLGGFKNIKANLDDLERHYPTYFGATLYWTFYMMEDLHGGYRSPTSQCFVHACISCLNNQNTLIAYVTRAW